MLAIKGPFWESLGMEQQRLSLVITPRHHDRLLCNIKFFIFQHRFSRQDKVWSLKPYSDGEWRSQTRISYLTSLDVLFTPAAQPLARNRIAKMAVCVGSAI
jgi:hypothetical protein